MLPELTRDDIAQGLRELGLAAGDAVLLHSSLSSIGRVVGGADAVIDAFLAVARTVSRVPRSATVGV